MTVILVGVVALNLILLYHLYLINKAEDRVLRETMTLLKEAENHELKSKMILREAEEYFARTKRE